MADIDRGTLDALLRAVEARLRARVPGLNEGNCFVSDEPLPVQIMHELTCTVSTGDGQFDDATFEGGGHQTLTEHLPLIVTILRRSMLDTPDRARTALLQPEAGLLVHYKPLLLKALLVEDGAAWDPLYNGDRFLRDSLAPVSFKAPRSMQDRAGQSYLSMQLEFRAYFDWSF